MTGSVGPASDAWEEELLPDALRADRRTFRRCGIYDAADWYDVDYAAYRAELTFYRLLLGRHAAGRVGEAARIVVELGAGTGRLTLPLVDGGSNGIAHTLHAVEPSAPMRALLVAKLKKAGLADAVVVEDALAATFVGPTSGAIGLVIFAFNGLLHIETRAALHASLLHIHGKLAHDGVLALDMTPPYWETMLRGHVPWGRIDERVHPTSGRRFLTCDRSTYQPTTRTTQIDIRYAYVDAVAGAGAGDEPGTQIELHQHMWTTPELLQSLDDCGFVVDASFGDVDLSSFDEGSPRLLVSARKKPPR